jgi:hypothetical protein
VDNCVTLFITGCSFCIDNGAFGFVNALVASRSTTLASEFLFALLTFVPGFTLLWFEQFTALELCFELFTALGFCFVMSAALFSFVLFAAEVGFAPFTAQEPLIALECGFAKPLTTES